MVMCNSNADTVRYIFRASRADNPKKHLGIATYSVKGLESDIEGSLKALADAGYVVMEISNYDPAKELLLVTNLPITLLWRRSTVWILFQATRVTNFNVKDVEGTLAAWGRYLTTIN